MNLFIYNLEGTLYEGKTDCLSMPAEDGEISVLPHHAPLVTSLKKGVLKIKNETETKEIPIEKGFVYIDGQNTIILSD